MDVREMNKETTVEDLVNFITRSVCYKCNYFNKTMGVCGGEILPIERAILRNLEGRGCCDDVKNIAEKLKEK